MPCHNKFCMESAAPILGVRSLEVTVFVRLEEDVTIIWVNKLLAFGATTSRGSSGLFRR